MIYSVTNKKHSKFQILTFCLLLNQNFELKFGNFVKINAIGLQFYDFASIPA